MQRDILFETIPGDPGPHGPYRDREHGPDVEIRLRMHPRTAATVLMLAALGGLALFVRSEQQRSARRRRLGVDALRRHQRNDAVHAW